MIDYEALRHIPPDCGYDEWIRVGMALKEEGASCDVWEDWSSGGGSKYKYGECEKKWRSFQSTGVTGGTIRHIAERYGYHPMENVNYDIHNLLLDEAIVDPSFVSQESLPYFNEKEYNPVGDMREYMKELFRPDDYVGLCLQFYKDKDGHHRPAKTTYNRTADDIIAKLESDAEDPILSALGPTDPSAGVYVRFNPLDGEGENNSNVKRWKHCLIESDTDSIDTQYTLLKAMNLPITFLVHSGGKSLHAIVRVDAENAGQYKQRVKELYEFCKKNGLNVDEQDKNESRFSRLPGVRRGSKWQYIVARNIGAASYEAWIEWRQEQVDDLPKEVNLADVWDKMPPLKDELIPGVLRQGHKLLLAGPSKAGKSFFLMSLGIAIAEGIDWIGYKCKQGRVCYVNLELDDASCLHRLRDIYTKLGIKPQHLDNFDILNLRGKSEPMDHLTPILINRYRNKQYSAIIIDPIYKVITGDENNATEMSQFCSYFDRITTEMGASLIYCHHHSKGASGKYANAMDRSSGSGVFARDPDAILDLRELNVAGIEEKYKARYEDASEVLTGWELNGTLREFAPMAARRIWFDYPLHREDKENFLAAAKYLDSGTSGKGVGKGQTGKEDRYELAKELLETAEITGDTAITLEQLGVSRDTGRKTFGPETEYAVVTAYVDGEKIHMLHRRDDEEIHYKDQVYRLNYKKKQWLPVEE